MLHFLFSKINDPTRMHTGARRSALPCWTRVPRRCCVRSRAPTRLAQRRALRHCAILDWRITTEWGVNAQCVL